MKPAGLFFVFLLFTGIGTGMFYHHVSRGGITDTGMAIDAAYYVSAMNGAPLDSIPKHYRFRVGHWFLASHVPDLPPGLFNLTGTQQILFRFGLISLLALTLSCWLLYDLLIRSDFDPVFSLISVILWETSFYITSWIFQPLPDSLSYLAIILCLWLIKQKRFWLAGLLMIPGMLVKETTLAVGLLIWILPFSKREYLSSLLWMLPSIAFYWWFRTLFPHESGHVFTPDRFLSGLNNIIAPGAHTLYWLISAFLSWQFCWIPILYGYYLVLKRQVQVPGNLLLIIPLFLIAPFLINASTIGRLWLIGFPAFVILCTIGLEAGYRQFMKRLPVK